MVTALAKSLRVAWLSGILLTISLLVPCIASSAAEPTNLLDPTITIDDAKNFQKASAAAGPTSQLDLQAEAAILMDATSGAVLYEKNSHEPFAPASITKVMTLALIFDALQAGKVSLDDRVITSERAAGLGGSQIWLEPGEEMTLKELLTAIAVGSANDAAVAAAEHVAGSEEQFVNLMNSKAKELGMRDSHFRNVHGLDEDNHVMSAYDVALASKFAVRFPELLKLTSTWEYYLRGGKSWLVNTNKLLKRMPGVDGLKTGSTDRAGFSISATAVRDLTRLIAVVMKAPSSEARFSDAMKLLTYGFANYRTVRFMEEGSVAASVRVFKGVEDEIELVASQNVAVTVPKGQEGKVTYVIETPPSVTAPITKGDKIGIITVFKENQELLKVPLVASSNVERSTFSHNFQKAINRILGFYTR